MRDKGENIFTKNYIIVLLALLSCLLWGSAFPSIKIGYKLFSIGDDDTFAKIIFAGFRFFLSSMMIFLFCLGTKRTLKVKNSDLRKLVLLGLIQTAIQYTFFYIGLSNTSGTKGSILASTSTFFAVILAHFFYEEDKLDIRKIIGVVLGFIGVSIVNMSGNGIHGGFTFTGDGFVIISSLMGALGGIYTKKIAKDMDPFVVSGYQLFIGSLFLIVAGLLGGERGLVSTPEGYGLLLYLAFISAAAFSMWTILLKYNGVGKISIYKFSIPIFGVFLSYIFLGERLLGTNVLLSIILVSASIILINKEKFIISHDTNKIIFCNMKDKK
ncbi:DMT family transporter [Sporanaerobacter acetigenes]|uniref:Permease of the drug/metabolite transporter (DMT) superfamily n=2 Tax=Sporanaerobacter acetigenes TaxID=165813 RepID=A0A1M5YVU0_9FIRM|nr:DMT family transporter [Sporanaerobacter acetigenes]SHI15970.1 Permease of the drug/metabolite transporter (DMT) superfamily [Sporanaerobacter acetigenes DSM 13106]